MVILFVFKSILLRCLGIAPEAHRIKELSRNRMLYNNSKQWVWAVLKQPRYAVADKMTYLAIGCVLTEH